MIIQAHFENIKQILTEEIKDSRSSIKVAVAWFTDLELFQNLIEKASQNIEVDLIILDDDINNSSNIDYELLKEHNGRVWKISERNRKSLMHNKFCIIDQSTIITGSYNWSYKARTNHENITVVKENHDLIKQFDKEFQRIFKYYFPNDQTKRQIDKTVNSKEVVSHSKFSESVLIAELKLLKIQVLGIENELAFVEKSITDFTTLYDIKLGPILMELLELKKKVIENLDDNNQSQKDAEEQFNNFKESYEDSKNKGWKDLTSEQSKELKKVFRQATKLCHPDLVNESEKRNAESIFNELKNLSELNDLQGVKDLYAHLKKGVFTEININSENQEIRKLKANINRLKIKRETFEKRILQLKKSDTYITVINITSKDEYFDYMQLKIRNQIQDIRENYEKKLTTKE